ncbi:MAG: hypothetical protein AABY30_06380 [Candidatus Thermoplasmatota archaeon]
MRIERAWTRAMEALPPRPQPQDCPECGAPVAHESGCTVCRSCGHSACG